MKKLALAFALLATVALAQDRRGPDGAPAVGDVAPIFTAKVLGKNESVGLASVLEKEKRPVVLIFGSYT
jgi:hypothetical protein